MNIKVEEKGWTVLAKSPAFAIHDEISFLFSYRAQCPPPRRPEVCCVPDCPSSTQPPRRQAKHGICWVFRGHRRKESAPPLYSAFRCATSFFPFSSRVLHVGYFYPSLPPSDPGVLSFFPFLSGRCYLKAHACPSLLLGWPPWRSCATIPFCQSLFEARRLDFPTDLLSGQDFLRFLTSSAPSRLPIFSPRSP